MIAEILAWVCLGWYVFILIVCSIGVFQIHRNFSSKPPTPISATLPLDNVPHVTILRPVKGIEPHLYACLAATFQQNYPKQKLTIYFCIASRSDPAFLILEQVLFDFPDYDAKILVEEEDPNLSGKDGDTYNLGPNPKIRNMSRGYREAKGDVMWIIDCNVWVSRSVCGNMVDRLCGFVADGRKYKFVHQLPLVIDISESLASPSPGINNGNGNSKQTSHEAGKTRKKRHWGSLLEELFLSTSHAKFYTAISTVAIAPCIVGKSNMFRRSHLNALTSTSTAYAPGIDFFSNNICEDHLIGDILWKRAIPPSILAAAEKEGSTPSQTEPPSGEREKGKKKNRKWSNHALLPHSLAIQPMSHTPLRTYLARRTRWLRVRKFTVPLATIVEPGTESLLCSAYGAFAFATLPLFSHIAEVVGGGQNWTAFATFWITSVTAWMLVDWYVWTTLQSGMTFGGEEGEPDFVRMRRRVNHGTGRSDGSWGRRDLLSARKWYSDRIYPWLGREILALGVWSWAVVGGVEVDWRGRKFRVGWDASVREIGDVRGEVGTRAGGHGDGRATSFGNGNGDRDRKRK